MIHLVEEIEDSHKKYFVRYEGGELSGLDNLALTLINGCFLFHTDLDA